MQAICDRASLVAVNVCVCLPRTKFNALSEQKAIFVFKCLRIPFNFGYDDPTNNSDATRGGSIVQSQSNTAVLISDYSFRTSPCSRND